MVREDNVHVDLSIPRPLWDVFLKEISIDKAFTYKGLISEKASEAFKFYISHLRKRRGNMQHSTQQMQNVKKHDDLIELRDKIYEYLQDTEIDGIIPWPDGPPPQRTIPSDYLSLAIKSIKGDDKRTIKKWTRRLLEAGIIEGTGPKSYKFTENEPTIIDDSLDKVLTPHEVESKVNEQQSSIVKQ